MNERYKKLTVKLCNVLHKETLRFLLENLEEEEDTSDIVNLILSGHISSLFNNMMDVTDTNKPMNDLVKEFIDKMADFIAKSHPIKEVVYIKND